MLAPHRTEAALVVIAYQIALPLVRTARNSSDLCRAQLQPALNLKDASKAA